MLTSLLLVHAAATLFMTGLIWFVQVVHYPLAASVGEASFIEYQREHVRRTGLVVAPVMLLEAGSAVAITFQSAGLLWVLSLAGLILLIVLWSATALLQVPLHGRLERHGKDRHAIASLVRGNWIRTLAWSGRAALAIVMLTVSAH